MSDGVSLCNMAHPRAAWYRRLWDWCKRLGRQPRLNPDTLETIEVDLP